MVLTKIKIEKYIFPVLELRFKNKRIMYLNNDVELCRAQLEIAKEKSDSYSVKFKNNVIKINSRGELEKWPKGMHDALLLVYAELYKLRQNLIK